MKKWILISSHRRSGTHFLIDSLCLNIKNAYFPGSWSLPADFNIGSLYRKNEAIYKAFTRQLNKNRITIIKSHLLPEEMNLNNPNNKYEKLIKKIYSESYKLYIYRNGYNVLTSLYNFLKTDIPFSDFLKRSNSFLSPVHINHTGKDFVHFYAYHLAEWFSQKNVIFISFENLKENFDISLRRILDEIHERQTGQFIRPEIPRCKIIHKLKLKLYNYGFFSKIGNTSYKPTKGKAKTNTNYFDQDSFEYFNSVMQLYGLSNLIPPE